MKAITNVSGVDGTGKTLNDATILIKDGKFTSIGTSSIPDGYEIIDASGTYFTPGLIDVHTHLGVHERRNRKRRARLQWNERCSHATGARY